MYKSFTTPVLAVFLLFCHGLLHAGECTDTIQDEALETHRSVMADTIRILPLEIRLGAAGNSHFYGVNVLGGMEDTAIYGLDTAILFGQDHRNSLYGLGFRLNSRYEIVYGADFGLLASDSKRNYGLQFGTFGTSSYENHGLQLACVNRNGIIAGMQLGAFNRSDGLNGVQLGVFNSCYGESSGGVQLGVINNSRNAAFQIGIINANEDGFVPTFPLFNFSVGRRK